jgi:xylulokinase
MAERLVLGIDVGSSAAKAVLAGTSGSVLARATWPQTVRRPGAGLVEQDPADWWEALRVLVRHLLTAVPTKSLAGLAISAHFPTLLLTNGAGEPLLPALLYADTRADPWVAEAARITGENLLGDEIVPKLLWLRATRPDLLDQVRHLFNPQDYLGYRLCGQHAVDHRTAVRTGGLFDVERLAWRDDVARSVGLDPTVLPEIRAAGSILGTVSVDAAQQTGIPAGTPVIVSLPDTPAALLGAGVVRQGDVLLYYGTTATADACLHDAEVYLRNPALIAQGGLYREVAYAVLGPALPWAASGFTGLAQAPTDLEALDDAVAALPTDPDAPFVMPYFMAHARSDLVVRRPAIVGFDVQHNRADLHRALLESFGYVIRAGLEDAGMWQAHQRFSAAGGGARSETWRQIVSDVLGADQEWVAASDGALGDAMLAAWAVGEVDTFGAGRARWLTAPVVTRPRSEAHRVHETRYATWRRLRDTLWAAFQPC